MLNRIDAFLRSVLYVLVRLYQRAVAPLLFPSCRFEPSCSNYALEALQTWPVAPALWLILRRLMRCQPFCRPGLDPVPPYPGHPGHRALKGAWIPRRDPAAASPHSPHSRTHDPFCRKEGPSAHAS